jgi:hypothetical protein
MFSPRYLISKDISWSELSFNKFGTHLLEYNFNQIDWTYLSMNKSDEAIYILKNNKDRIIWTSLSSNENDFAIELLKENKKNINWYYLSLNTSEKAVQLLRENKDKIHWVALSENYNAIDLIEEDLNKIYFPYLFMNKNAMKIIKKNENIICWDLLACNTSIEAIDMVDNYINSVLIEKYNNEDVEVWYKDYIDWFNVSKNPMAFKILIKNINRINWNGLCINTNDDCLKILEENQDKITNWDLLCENTSQRAIKILEKNIDKINWDILSSNKGAISLLENNKDKINWDYISYNENAIHLFAPLDHAYMREKTVEFKNELINYIISSDRLSRISIHELYYKGIPFIEMLNIINNIYF